MIGLAGYDMTGVGFDRTCNAYDLNAMYGMWLAVFTQEKRCTQYALPTIKIYDNTSGMPYKAEWHVLGTDEHSM